MVLFICPCSSTSIQRENFLESTHPVQCNGNAFLKGDSIRFGTDNESFFSHIATKVKIFFQWIYLKARCLLRKIFFCFQYEETTAEKFQRNIAELDLLGSSFEKKCRGDREILKSWWKKAFDSLDFDIRKMLILEDIKTYAPQGFDDAAAWANEHFSEYRDLAAKFVRELEIVTILGESYDPIENIPAYIESVKAELESV